MENKIVVLVNLWAKYEAQDPGITIEEFCAKYLADQVPAPTRGPDAMGISINGQLAGGIGKLNRYASLYCKKALAHVGLDNIEDWVYLINLQEMGTPKKSELIYEMVSEFPSGIGIIKRLVGLGLVEEFPDKQDKRSKRLRIMEKGVQVLMASFPYMEKVGSMAFDTLSAGEKFTVVSILKRLDHYHSSHYKHVRNAEFEHAFERLVP